METKTFDVFISFSMSELDGDYSKSYYEAKKLSNILNNLLGINSYFCNKNLSERETKDFQDELMDKVEKSKIFVLILLDYSDTDKPYFKSERVKYIDTHQKEGSFIILASDKAIKRIDTLDIMKDIKYHPDIFNINDIGGYQRFLNLINHLSYWNNVKKVNDIKICKRCHKIFHDGNDEGTTCVYHPGKLIYKSVKSLVGQFSCCNQKYIVENQNEIVEISPGCCESIHDFEKFD